MGEGIFEINDGNFEAEVLQADKPVMVDFWASWCGPCRAMAPILEEIAEAFGDKIKITKCNVDDNPVTPAKFGIRSIPTLIFFKEGEAREQIVGIVAKTRLEEVINSIL